MLEIQSKKVNVNQSAEAIFDHFQNLQNMHQLMPESVQRFEADDETFLFGIKGLPDVRLLREGQERPRSMRFKSASSKLNFHLFVDINATSENTCEVSYRFAGDFNPMLRMMAERPLRNFIEELATKTANL